MNRVSADFPTIGQDCRESMAHRVFCNASLDGDSIGVQSIVVGFHAAIDLFYPVVLIFNFNVSPDLRGESGGFGEVGMEGAAVPPAVLGWIAPRLPGQCGFDEGNAHGLTKCLGHTLGIFQQVIAVDDGWWGSVQCPEQVEERSLFWKTDLSFVKVRPSIVHGRDGFCGVTDEEGMGETREKGLVPHVVDIVGEIFHENRACRSLGLDVLPHPVEGQPGCGDASWLEAMPKRSLPLIPGLTKGLVEAVQVAPLAHHPFEGR